MVHHIQPLKFALPLAFFSFFISYDLFGALTINKTLSKYFAELEIIKLSIPIKHVTLVCNNC